MMLVARNRQATLIYERSAELNDGFHPFLTKIEKNAGAISYRSVISPKILFFTLISEGRLRINSGKLDRELDDAPLLFHPDVKPVTEQHRSSCSKL